jgi:membrane associated rhomboid family serine protease
MSDAQPIEKVRLRNSVIVGLIFIFIIWIIKVMEWIFGIDLTFLGIYPLKASGLIGIITAPLIHADFAHTGANSIPLFVSVTMIWYFYRTVAWKVYGLIWIMTGLWVWTFARESYHIGASGIVYGYISFLFFSGIIRRNLQLMAVSMLMVFLYGGLFWGIFPDFFPHRNISWESHLMGGLAGFIIAIFYRKQGIQRHKYSWELEGEDEDDDDSGLPWNKPDESNQNVS